MCTSRHRSNSKDSRSALFIRHFIPDSSRAAIATTSNGHHDPQRAAATGFDILRRDQAVQRGGIDGFEPVCIAHFGEQQVEQFGQVERVGRAREHEQPQSLAELSDEGHARRKPEIGERLTVIPNHCCSVSNMVDEVYGTRDGEIEVVWPVAARGQVR